MKVHISLNVSEFERSVEFYKKMLGIEPVKIKGNKGSGYAKFDLADPALNLVLNEGAVERGRGLSHLGLQVETTDDVLEVKERWEQAGLLTVDEMDVTCCYAKQDKTWVRDPDGNEWEVFVVLEDVEAMTEEEASCCDGDQTDGCDVRTETKPTAVAETASCC